MEGTRSTTGILPRDFGGLPSPPALLAKIRETVYNTESSAKDIAEVMKLDPVIVGKVLRLANSAYIGMPKAVSNVQNAIALLGQKRIGALLISASLSAALGGLKPSGFPLQGFWIHSAAAGLIAEAIGKHVRRYYAVDPNDLFAAAVMHDIGKLALARFAPQVLADAAERCRSQAVPFNEAEETDYSHAMLGGAIAERWSFPDDLTSAIAHHHQPAEAREHIRLAQVVHLSDAMTHAIGLHVYEREPSPRVDAAALEAVSLPLERLRVIAEEVLARQKEMDSLSAFFTE
jgi:putative nucleotidyltransferase with HDIG domain